MYLVGVRSVTQQLGERVIAGQLVVAVGEQQDDWQLPDPAYQKAQRVDGGLVGPVDILDDQRARWRMVQLGEQGSHDLVALTRLQSFGQPGADGSSQIPKRPERSRRTERVAGANQHPRPVREF